MNATTDAAVATKGKGMRWFIDSMWGYWLFLLTISLSLAAVIYFVWLKGSL